MKTKKYIALVGGFCSGQYQVIDRDAPLDEHGDPKNWHDAPWWDWDGCKEVIHFDAPNMKCAKVFADELMHEMFSDEDHKALLSIGEILELK